MPLGAVWEGSLSLSPAVSNAELLQVPGAEVALLAKDVKLSLESQAQVGRPQLAAGGPSECYCCSPQILTSARALDAPPVSRENRKAGASRAEQKGSLAAECSGGLPPVSFPGLAKMKPWAPHVALGQDPGPCPSPVLVCPLGARGGRHQLPLAQESLGAGASADTPRDPPGRCTDSLPRQKTGSAWRPGAGQGGACCPCRLATTGQEQKRAKKSWVELV